MLHTCFRCFLNCVNFTVFCAKRR